MTIAFAMVFFGLVTGVHPVELVVGPEVARVELFLDGDLVAERDAGPWEIPCDFGELAPHELVAVARDAKGEELGRARQWVNLPPWDARAGGEATERTAVAVEVSRRGRRLRLDAVARHLEIGGVPAEPVALAGEDAEVLLVVDRAAPGRVRLMAHYWQGSTRRVGPTGAPPEGVRSSAVTTGRLYGPSGREQTRVLGDEHDEDVDLSGWDNRLRTELRLHEGQGARFVSPFAQKDVEEVSFRLFPRTRAYPPSAGGLLWFLSVMRQPEAPADEQRLADAVTVAGMEAAASGRRRAVVLVLSRHPADSSTLSPRAVRRYLEHLGVPLHVWSIGEPPAEVAEAWGEVREVQEQRLFEDAVEDLSRSLDRQRIVWVEGLHLPQSATLAEGARGLSLIH